MDDDQANGRSIRSGYSKIGQDASGAMLVEVLKKTLGERGCVSFATFMNEALYHPIHGYYSSGGERVGKGGDFYTSVSVGETFGHLLARRLWGLWKSMGSPAKFVVVEAGADRAALSVDILKAAGALSAEFGASIVYQIVEPSAHLREAQHAAVKGADLAMEQVEWATSWQQVGKVVGAVVTNELVDAFPVKVLRFSDGRWRERMVAMAEDGESFVWQDVVIEDDDLAAFAMKLGNDYPDGYTTEYHSAYAAWVDQVSGVLQRGLWLTVDYGLSGPDYYEVSRSEGTVRGYRAHRQTNEVLMTPGCMDLTTDVNFTYLAELGLAAGFEFGGFARQANYLTAVAEPWLLELEREGRAVAQKRLKEFQTLTHPGFLGSRFYMLEMFRGMSPERSPFRFAQNGAEHLALA